MTIGTIIEHHYRVTELIGTGGMAHVFLATSIATGRNVAIKTLKEEFREEPEFLRRFEQEAKAILRFSHENIVRAYGVGYYDGLPYIIMEYVPGKTLKDIIAANGPMPAKTAISVTCQILQALHAAHEAGFIHRDVKPHNVILTQDGRAKLADFGIARDTNANTRTMAGDKVIGSVQYISPEQATGTEVSASSDIYSTGIMLYEMLTGTVPFHGETNVAVALKHINEQPEEPILRNAQVTPALNAIIMRALQKNPAQRYSSAREMRSALLKASRDPSGASLQEPDAPVPEAEPIMPPSPATRKPKGSIAVPLISIGIVLICICALIGTFMAVRSSFASRNSIMDVPTLLAKPLEEATAKAQDYGFTLSIAGYDFSNDFEKGTILSQVPDVGTTAKKGSPITVMVSSGPETNVIPPLTGMTLDEARAMLQSIGMDIGSITYRVSDIAIGYICEQSPSAGEDVQEGSTVNICISATSTETLELPSLVGYTFEDALTLLSEFGIDSIRIRYLDNRPGDTGIISEQYPNVATISKGTMVTLSVTNDEYSEFFCDHVMNVTTDSSGCSFVATIDDSFQGISYSRVVYETTLEKGTQLPVSFTAFAHTAGMHEMTITIDGTERRFDVDFKERKQP